MIAHGTGRGFSRASTEGSLTPTDARRIAEGALAERYPQADFGFVAGSIMLARELAPHGGFLFDGYRRAAKPEWRIETDEAVWS